MLLQIFVYHIVKYYVKYRQIVSSYYVGIYKNRGTFELSFSDSCGSFSFVKLVEAEGLIFVLLKCSCQKGKVVHELFPQEPKT